MFQHFRKEGSMCFDQLTSIIGLTVCGEISMPSTLATNHVAFPMNGNVNMQISIEAEDLKEYHFTALLKEPSKFSKNWNALVIIVTIIVWFQTLTAELWK